MTILDPSGFGERTGRSPYMTDLVDEVTFHKSMWKSCFRVDDMTTWSNWVDGLTELAASDPVQVIKQRKLSHLPWLWNILSLAMFARNTRLVNQDNH